MDKKLTDSEIVKALPFLAKYCKDEYNDIRVDEVLLGAFDLINRLQEKDKTRHKVFETKCEELEIAKAENERLKIAFNNQTLNTKYWRIRCDELVEENLTAKAEAYKECIDMVKKKGVKVGVDEICIFEGTLDNLLKEMVGE